MRILNILDRVVPVFLLCLCTNTESFFFPVILLSTYLEYLSCFLYLSFTEKSAYRIKSCAKCMLLLLPIVISNSGTGCSDKAFLGLGLAADPVLLLQYIHTLKEMKMGCRLNGYSNSMCTEINES